MPKPDMRVRLLRLFLGFAAFAWGISVVGVFLSLRANKNSSSIGERWVLAGASIAPWPKSMRSSTSRQAAERGGDRRDPGGRPLECQQQPA